MLARSTAKEVLQLWKVTFAEGRCAILMKHTYMQQQQQQQHNDKTLQRQPASHSDRMQHCLMVVAAAGGVPVPVHARTIHACMHACTDAWTHKQGLPMTYRVPRTVVGPLKRNLLKT